MAAGPRPARLAHDEVRLGENRRLGLGSHDAGGRNNDGTMTSWITSIRLANVLGNSQGVLCHTRLPSFRLARCNESLTDA